MSAASASASERAVFDDDIDDGDDGTDADDSSFDDDTDDERRHPVPPPPPPTTTAPAPVQAPAAPLNGAQPAPFPEVKIEDRRSLVPFPDDSRRLFQRLWTDDDEIKILRGFLEFTTQRGTTFASHQYDTGPFYERIKRELQLDFSKNQLIEKLRRLKKKFRNAAARIAAGKESVFKSPHDQATFEISRKIWSAGLKNGRDSDDDDLNTTPASASASAIDLSTTTTAPRTRRRRVRRRVEETPTLALEPSAQLDDPAKMVLALPPVAAAAAPPPMPPTPAPVTNVIEETVKGCLGPLFKELLASVVGAPGIAFGGLALNALVPLGSVGSLLNPIPQGAEGDEKWRKQQILELEVYQKRIELLQEQVKTTLEELKSRSSTDKSNLEELKTPGS